MSTAPDLRRLITGAAWVTAVVVALISATSGLPAGTTAATATVALTVVGLGLWCVALLPGAPPRGCSPRCWSERGWPGPHSS